MVRLSYPIRQPQIVPRPNGVCSPPNLQPWGPDDAFCPSLQALKQFPRPHGGCRASVLSKVLGRYFGDLAAPRARFYFLCWGRSGIENLEAVDCVLHWRPFRWLSGRRSRVRVCCLFLSCLVAVQPSTPVAYAQKAEDNLSARKLIAQVDADYPPDLKRAYIGGVVRLDIVVNARGSVDSIRIAGGNPILAECAVKAVKHWKYSPAASATNIRVNLHFDPTH
jgi:TonB family protein